MAKRTVVAARDDQHSTRVRGRLGAGERLRDSAWEKTLAATPESVRIARDTAAQMAAQAAASDQDVDSIRLAVSEAVTNVVRHAYPGRRGPVQILIAGVEDRELAILVADRGCGLRRPSTNPGCGFGMKLMAQTADDLVIAERSGGGTEVRLTFRLHRRSGRARRGPNTKPARID